jgi:hypothetical protein
MNVFIPTRDGVFSIRNKALEFYADVSHEAFQADCQRSNGPDFNPNLKRGRFIHPVIGLMALLNRPAKFASCFLC